MGETWRRHAPVELTAAEAVARAGALLDEMPSAGPPALAWSTVDPPALVLGRSHRDPTYDAGACQAEGVDVVRRASGGGPLLWDRDLLALDVALPEGHRLAGEDVVEAYRWLGEALAEAVTALGAGETIAIGVDEARSGPSDEVAEACFGGLSPHEVLSGGRKVVGLSQVRRRAGTLLQAGIALRFDAPRLARLMGRDEDFAATLAARAAGLDELGAGADAAEVVAAIERAIVERAGIESNIEQGSWPPS